MKEDYFMEDGHYMNEEERIAAHVWSIVELINENFSNEDIFMYKNSREWESLVEKILRRYKRL